MAKKPKRRTNKKVEKYVGKTEEEWRDWGEEFGKTMAKRGKDFVEEVEKLSEKFSKHAELKSREFSKDWKMWWFKTFGFIGPLIESIFGVIVISIGILALKFVNLPLHSSFISALANFVFSNLYWIFAAFLVFNYIDYFSKRYAKTYWITSPIIDSIGLAVMILIAVWIINFLNTFVRSSFTTYVSNFLYTNIVGIFFVFLVLGYAIMFIRKIFIYPSRV
jgi:hypothetical protein